MDINSMTSEVMLALLKKAGYVAADGKPIAMLGYATEIDSTVNLEHFHPPAVPNGDPGFMTGADKAKLDGVEAGANNYVHPVNHPASIITQDVNNRFVSDAEKTVWNNKTTGTVVTPTEDGIMIAADKVKLDGIEAGANNYVHPANHPPSIITQDAANRFVTDVEKTTWDGKASTDVVTQSVNGLMIAADKTKLDGIAAGAEVNQNTFSTVSVTGQANVVADQKADALTLAGGTGITITTNAATDTVTITATGTATPGPHAVTHLTGGADPINVVTTLADGLMIAADKSKLDGVAAGATNYVHPANHPPSIITQDADNRFVSDAEKATWNAGTGTSAPVTSTENGLMISTDKVKLDGIADSANNYVHPANHPPSIITQDESNRFVTDTEKTDWNGKANIDSPIFTGLPSAPTAPLGTNSTQIATMEAVKAATDSAADTSGLATKASLYPLEREIANLKAASTLSNRVDGASGLFYDLNDGLNGGSIGKIDLSKTNSNQALPIGTTILTDKVTSKPFTVGQEVTVFDDVNLERPTVTRAETITAPGTIAITSPTTVVASAYVSSGNGGRKLVRLSNGWLVACARNGTTSTIFYVSKDNGATWQQLCFVNGDVSNGFAIASNGTTVYAIFSQTTSNFFVKFDATTVTNTAQTPTAGADSGQTAIGSGISLTIDGTGVLHAAWSSKNATYPNSFNIRYSKSTDGGVTWAAPTQFNAQNSTNVDCLNPSIVIRNGNPVIVFQTGGSGTTTQWINAFYWTGSAWASTSTPVVIYSIANVSYIQQNPCAVVSPDGVIHVSWQGKDATDSTSNNIRYSKSTDGGATWSAMLKLTSGNTYTQAQSSITADKNNNLYIMWEGQDPSISASVYNIRRIIWNGTSWGSVTTLTNSTTGNIYSASTLSNYTDFTDPLTIYMDAQVVGIKFRGTWTASVTTNHLEITALTKDYKSGAQICRSSVVQDTTNKLLKFGGWSTIAPVAITSPTTVVASAYDTSGNGGRKLVRLSNGWLVSTVLDTTNFIIYVYKSQDNGSTWTQLFSMDTTTIHSVSLSSSGTNLYVLFTYNNTSASVYTCDATNVTNTDKLANRVNIDNATQSSMGGCSIAIDGTGALHAAWVSKNTTYPNSNNIRYSKSTDGGATWAAPTQITTFNGAGSDFTNPCIVIKNDGNPIIQVQFYDGVSYYIRSFRYTTSWQATITIHNATQAQSSPCAVVSPDGNIHVAWYGADATDAAAYNIRYSKSTDGGATWSAMLKLTSGNANNQQSPSVTADKNNNLYVVWHGVDTAVTASYFNIRRVIWNGATWGSITTITSNTTATAIDVQSLSNYTDFTDPLVIYKDNQSVGIKFRGTFQIGGITPVLVEDVRYNITPPSNVSSMVAWVDCDADPAAVTLSGAVAFKTGSGGNESFVNMTETTSYPDASTAEKQFVGNNATATSRATLRLTLARSNTSLTRNIIRITGAVGL